MIRIHHQLARGSAMWRIFHLFKMQCYWLVNHPLTTFSSRPSSSSLSLDMPSKLFHALSLQRRLRDPLTLLQTDMPCSTQHLSIKKSLFSTLKTNPTLKEISISANLCLPNHQLSEKLTTLSLCVQHICRSNSGGIAFWWKLIYCCLRHRWRVFGPIRWERRRRIERRKWCEERQKKRIRIF